MQHPKPGHTQYEELLVNIRKGAIKIPQFQRKFVWDCPQSSKLLDSILKGYPLGTFILWKTKERLRSVRNIGGIDLPPPPENDYVFQVLDGQQRITSLFAALEGVTLPGNDFSAIRVDLDADPTGDDAIVLPSEADMPQGHSCVAFTTLRTASIVDLMSKGYSTAQLKRLEEYQSRLKTYQFPTVEILDAPLAVATEIFTRLNVGGKRLSVFEIMVAKTYDEASKFDLNEKVEELNNQYSKTGFGFIDPTIMIQTVAAIAVQNIRARDILSLPKQSFLDKWPTAVNALSSAADFCVSDIGLPVSALLPYQSSLITLAYYFFLSGNVTPSGDTKSRLIDLFYRIGLSERYSKANEAKVGQDLKAVKLIFEGRPPEYDYGVDISADYIYRNGFFRTGKAFIKTLLCLLASQKPRCFKSGGHVILGNANLKQKNSRNYHHFFPIAFLGKTPGIKGQPNHIGNITLVGADLNKNQIRAKSPSTYIATFEKANAQLAECMATHLIDLDKMGVRRDDYDTFLSRRCAGMSGKLKDLIIPQPKDALPQPDLFQDEPDDADGETGIDTDEDYELGQVAG